MKRIDFFLSIFLAVFGLIMAVWVIPSQSAPGGRYGVPPSAVPIVCCVILAGLAVVLFFQSLPRTWIREGQARVQFAWRHIAVVSGIALAGTALMSFAGFIPSGVFVVAVSMLAMGVRSFWKIGLCSVLTPFVAYWLLWFGLRMPLP